MWLKRRANGDCENGNKTPYSIKSGGALTTDRHVDIGSGLLSDRAPGYLSWNTPNSSLQIAQESKTVSVFHSNLVLKIGL